jgi:hypothetical protein
MKNKLTVISGPPNKLELAAKANNDILKMLDPDFYEWIGMAKKYSRKTK